MTGEKCYLQRIGLGIPAQKLYQLELEFLPIYSINAFFATNSNELVLGLQWESGTWWAVSRHCETSSWHIYAMWMQHSRSIQLYRSNPFQFIHYFMKESFCLFFLLRSMIRTLWFLMKMDRWYDLVLLLDFERRLENAINYWLVKIWE